MPSSHSQVREAPTAPMSGRKAQAARNDGLILGAAREVFLADPGAPISEVSKRAGVGISALYKRYASKEDLLRKLCHDGLATFVEITEAALGDNREPTDVFETWMRRLVEADTSSLTRALAGTFVPTPDMYELAERANALSNELFDRVRGVLRPGIEVHDLSLMFELVAGVKLGDRARTLELRQRYLTVLLDGLQMPNAGPLPAPAPTWQEINERWAPAGP
jgi:AcrR family transcriptional regulator